MPHGKNDAAIAVIKQCILKITLPDWEGDFCTSGKYYAKAADMGNLSYKIII